MTHLTFYSAAVHVCPTLRSRRQVRGCYRLFHLFPVSSFIGGNLVSSPFWKPGRVADLILFFFPFHDSEREQAKESQYVRQREAEKLKEAKAKLAEAQAEVVSRLFHPPIRFPLSLILLHFHPSTHPSIHPSNHPIIVLHSARCIG